MRVDIPKNLWLSSVELDFFKEGLFAGSYGLTLNFTGNPVGTIEMMSEILEPLTALQMPKRKLVRFKGLFDKTDTGVSLALKAFNSWGFQTQAVVDVAQIDLPWLSEVNWLIIKTTKPFVPIASHEVWYTPVQSDEVPPEPKVPAPEKTLLFFAKGHSMSITTKFIVGAKNNWSLL